MEQRFWKPSLTSQFAICPVPYHMDTYRGCKYNCTYCFARDFTTFTRRNREGIDKEFTTLVANDPKADECCGTQILRDYKILGENFRTQAFKKEGNFSTLLPKCYITFTRQLREGTIETAIQERKKVIQSKKSSLFE